MKSPAFQFYVQDFMVGTLHFSAEEVGAYIRLLCHQWDVGYIEENEKKLKKITGISAKKCEKILKKFSKGEDGFLKNLRLEAERTKQLELRKRRSEAGRRGNDVKYNQSQSDPIATAKQAEKSRKGIALQSSSSSSTSIEIQNTVVEKASPSTSLFFEMFRRAAGRHITDGELLKEVGKFQNKYPNLHPNKAGALINTWVGNIGGDDYKPDSSPVKEMVF